MVFTHRLRSIQAGGRRVGLLFASQSSGSRFDSCSGKASLVKSVTCQDNLGLLTFQISIQYLHIEDAYSSVWAGNGFDTDKFIVVYHLEYFPWSCQNFYHLTMFIFEHTHGQTYFGHSWLPLLKLFYFDRDVVIAWMNLEGQMFTS